MVDVHTDGRDNFDLQKSGIQFKKHEEEGIDVNAFAEALMTSGVVLSEQASLEIGFSLLSWQD